MQLFQWTAFLFILQVREFHIQIGNTDSCSIADQYSCDLQHFSGKCKQSVNSVFKHTVLQHFLHHLANPILSSLVSWLSFSQKAQTAPNNRMCPNSPEQNSSTHSLWIFRQSSEPISLYIICSQPVNNWHIIWFTILITNYLCSIHYSLGTPLYLQLVGNSQVEKLQWYFVMLRVSGPCPPLQGSDSSVNIDQTPKNWGQVNWDQHRVVAINLCCLWWLY